MSPNQLNRPPQTVEMTTIAIGMIETAAIEEVDIVQTRKVVIEVARGTIVGGVGVEDIDIRLYSIRVVPVAYHFRSIR